MSLNSPLWSPEQPPRRARRRLGIQTTIAAMQAGASLHFGFRAGGGGWWLSTGTAVDPEIARRVIADPNVIGVGDTLFGDGRSQTYRHIG